MRQGSTRLTGRFVKGNLKDFLPYTFPLILGWEAAGIVRRVGEAVTLFKPGDPIFVLNEFTRPGCYAEFVTVDERNAAIKPGNINFVEAASLPLVGLTAWQALVDAANISEGKRVLIHAGAGGVGSFAIQLAKARGAWVATTCSAANIAFVKELGADEVIDYTKEDFTALLKEMDIVLDTMAGKVYRDSFKVMRRGGVIVSLLEEPDQELTAAYGVRAEHVLVKPNSRQLAEIGRLIESGSIQPVVKQVFPLEEVREAHNRSQSGHMVGKIVLKMKE